jgi:hypothetical protein
MLPTRYAAGAFMVLEWLALMPFGAMRSNIQAGLGDKLADQHLSTVSLKPFTHLKMLFMQCAYSGSMPLHCIAAV